MKLTKKYFPLVMLLLIVLILAMPMSIVSSHSNGAVQLAEQWSESDPASNWDVDPEKIIYIYFFWGDGCPHCATAKPILQEIADENPQVVLKSFEIYYNEENRKIFMDMAAAYGFEPRVVPTIMLADRFWEGFYDQVEIEIRAAIKSCMTGNCTDLGAEVLKAYQIPEPTMTPTVQLIIPTPTMPVVETPVVYEEPEVVVTPALEENKPSTTFSLPLIGKIDLSGQSNLLSTILIAFVDGFNPCSIWVLTMLLSITLHSGSRKKILIVGLVFISVTALIYALFIAGLFTVFTVISFGGWIRVVVALVALFFGLVNIKDYFWYKEGISFTIDDKSKPGLFRRMRRVMNAGDSMWGLIGGTIILAAGVSLVEFSCTAGFPVLWTNLLISQQVSVGTFILLLLVYMLVYQLDEMAIFLVAVFSLKSNKMEEKHGRILKLIGGVLMITLAVIMLVKPSLMNELGQSLIIFGIAFGATLLILLLHRLILPRFGIQIGSEFTVPTKKQETNNPGDKNANKE